MGTLGQLADGRGTALRSVAPGDRETGSGLAREQPRLSGAARCGRVAKEPRAGRVRGLVIETRREPEQIGAIVSESECEACS